MKIHLIRKETIERYAKFHPNSRQPLKDWLVKLKFADWETPEDIQNTFNAADILGNGSNRVVFDIAGNNFRIICKYWFGLERVHLYFKWIGTHTEYDKLSKKQEQYTVDIF